MKVGIFDEVFVIFLPSWLEVSDLVPDVSVKARALLGDALVPTLPWLDLYPSSETSELESQVDKVSFDDFLMGLAALPASLILPNPVALPTEDLFLFWLGVTEWIKLLDELAWAFCNKRLAEPCLAYKALALVGFEPWINCWEDEDRLFGLVMIFWGLVLIETVEPAWLGVKLELLRPKLFKFVVEDLLLGESVLKRNQF